jgi:hypothetical protein
MVRSLESAAVVSKERKGADGERVGVEGGTAKGGIGRGVEGLVLTLSIAMPAGLYVWMLGRPVPVPMGQAHATGQDPLTGMPAAFGIGILASLLVVGILGVWRSARVWRGRLAVAAAGLYLGACLPVIGTAALLLAPAAGTIILAGLIARGRVVVLDGLFLSVHAGLFGAAACFFNQWPQYAKGWEPFLKNLSALRRLLL